MPLGDLTTPLRALIASQKQRTFVKPEEASDEDALGILIAHNFEWDGLAILRTFFYALEDANFHSEAEQVANWIASNGGERP